MTTGRGLSPCQYQTATYCQVRYIVVCPSSCTNNLFLTKTQFASLGRNRWQEVCCILDNVVVQEALNVKPNTTFVSCSAEVGSVLGPDVMKTVKPLIPDLLAALPVLLYQGKPISLATSGSRGRNPSAVRPSTVSTTVCVAVADAFAAPFLLLCQGWFGCTGLSC